ncbi:TIGR03621 family F420-dependent LLM class oxidoreductase [Mycolicibacterium sediminis]|uniref:LLM class F420-dependent oxidoreductase n=1 Tax=Mycolicibacterium sediminis TaxID=1286180 RepID=A0A7I7QSU6_9MYCO|nr:TIGR03621 family F420-dependent LLM class oxidoreductase [Mycolicibacterium sediminis]BBY29325.1 LLM class F420-dependent oxidoreductase [Mycolicibacterium sediminis]
MDSPAARSHRTRPLRFGLTTALPRGPEFADYALAVEDLGVDVMTFADHLVPSLSPIVGAAAAAAATTRMHSGTLVLNNDFRHPVEVAREAATLAAVSGGRFELGLGAGHMKSEYDAAGLTFEWSSTRVDRLVESVEIIRALLAGESVDVDGDHYRMHADAGQLVAPPTSPVPLLLGGNGDRVLQLAGRVADIAGFAGIAHSRDATEVRMSHFDDRGLTDRIDVVRQAAGDRFEAIELQALIQFVVPTVDRAAAATELATTVSGLTPAQILDSPFVLLGTHDEMAETLVDRQRRFGISYWTVFDELPGRPSALPDIAKVMTLLRA